MKLQTDEVVGSEEDEEEETNPGRFVKIQRADTDDWENKCILVINLRKFISKLKQTAAVQNERWLKTSCL